MTENTWPRLVTSQAAHAENACRRGQVVGAGCRWACGGENQYRAIEQVVVSKVHRIVLSGPWTTRRCGETRSGLASRKPPDRSAAVPGGGTGGRWRGLRGCQGPPGVLAVAAVSEVHSMQRW